MGVTKRNSNNISRRATRKRFLRALAYRGLPTRVARGLGLSRQYVSMVMTGKRKSARVEAAVVAELDRLEHETAA